MNWNFNANEYQENDYGTLKPGDYRVRIKEAEEKISRAGNPMLKITLEVSGSSSLLWYYIVFDSSNTSMTNQKLGTFWNAFGIQQGNLDEKTYAGKVGGVRVKIENDSQYGERAVIHYLLKPSQTENLPAWTEPPKNVSNQSAPQQTTNNNPMPNNYYGTPSEPPFNPNDLL